MSVDLNLIAQGVSGTPGTGTITLGAALPGFRALAATVDGVAVNGKLLDVLLTDGTDQSVEIDCLYNSTAGTLARGTVESSTTGARLSLTSAAQVRVVAAASRSTAWQNNLGVVVVSGTPTAGQVPTATSGTAATWQTPSGGGSPGGSSGQIQFNNAGSFAGAANAAILSANVGGAAGSQNCIALGDGGANPALYSVRGSPSVNGPHGLCYFGAPINGPVLAGYDQGTGRLVGIGFLNFSMSTLRMALTCENSTLKTDFGGPIYPKQYTTATRPAWVNGAVIFDTDLDKLVIGGVSAWEVVTSA